LATLDLLVRISFHPTATGHDGGRERLGEPDKTQVMPAQPRKGVARRR